MSNRFTIIHNIQVDYVPGLVDEGHLDAIKEANEAINIMNGFISGFKSPNVSVHAKHTDVEAWIIIGLWKEFHCAMVMSCRKYCH